MVCRSTPGNSALTTYARLHSGVDDVQVLSMFHELRNDAPAGSMPPSDAEYRAFLTGIRLGVRDDGALSDTRRASLLNRLERAQTQRPDAATYYAWRTINDRAIRARAALDAHFTEIADRHGSTPEQVQAAFRRIAKGNREAGRNAPRPPAHLEYDTAGVPADRATRYALAILYLAGPRAATNQAAHYQAREEMEANSSAAAAAEEYAADVAADAGGGNQCPNCGQFAGEGHFCADVAAASHLSASALVDAAREGQVLAEQATVLPPYDAERHGRDCPQCGQYHGQDHCSADARTEGAPEQTVRIGGGNRSLGEARDRLTREGETYVTTDGQRFLSLGRAALHERTLPVDPQPFVRSLSEARGRLAHINGQHVTSDGRQFSNVVEALRHEFRLTNCPNCGQFAGEGHTCPAPSVAVTFDEVQEFLQPAAPAVDLDTDREIAERLAGVRQTRNLLSRTQAPAPAVRRRTPMRTYQSDDASVQMMNVSQVRTDARQADGAPVTLDDVSVTLTEGATTSYGDFRRTTVGRVAGSVTVTFNADPRIRRGRDRFAVSPVPGERSLRCTCAQYRTNYDCPHIRQACEEIRARLNDRDAVATAPVTAVDEVRSALYEDYQQSLNSQQEARDAFTGAQSGVSYAEDMVAFQGAWDEAKERLERGDHRLPYLTENATNGLGARVGGRSFGVEIEVDFPDDVTYEAKQQVAREIYEAGLSQSPYVQGWRSAARAGGARMGQGYSDDPNRWSVEFDRSVDDVGGQRGCEIVSPILYDTPETWENLAKVCEIVERHGGRATTRTGLHVNVGAGDYNHTVGNHNRLLRMSEAYEDVIVRCSHNPQSGPTHRGRRFCQPSQVPASGYRRISDALSDNGHYSMVNLTHLPAEGQRVTGSTRVEVRIFDGTVDPGRLQTNIKVALGLVSAAHRGVEPGVEPEPAGSHRAGRQVGSNGRARRLSGDAWTQDTASFRKFADAMFSREEDKKQLVGAFASSRWQAPAR